MSTRLPPEAYLKLWQTAAEQEIGLHISCMPEDQLKLVNALYECKQIHGGFENLMLMQPQPPGTIYIMKQTVEMPS